MEQAPTPLKLKFGPFVADLAAGEVRKNGSRLRLQDKPLRVLALLAERQGEVVTREELQKRLWPGDTFVDFETGLNTAVSKLRDALSDSAEAPRYIETLPRRGYRFLMPVEFPNGHRPGAEISERIQTQVATPPVAPSARATPEPKVREAVSAKPGIRKPVWILLGGAVALLAFGAYWLTHGRAAFSFHSRDSVLIADFENQTGDPRFDTALTTAFSIGIEQSRYANIFPQLRRDSALERMGKPSNARITPSLGREICQRESIRGLIVSSITRTGQEYAVTAQLIDPQSGETVGSYTERANGEDHILDALDVLSRDIREALGESLYQIHQAGKPLPQVTTRSLTALQQYADGVALWRRGKFQDGGAMFKAAVASDPDFAMAHAALGGADYSYIYNQPEEGKKEYDKALSLTSRTTDRERMIIQARSTQDRHHLGDAEPLFLDYLSHYPDDTSMRFDYANLLRSDGREADAIEQYKEVTRVAPDFAHAYIGLATAYKTLNNFPAALQAYSSAFELDPHWLTRGNVNREYGFTLVSNGEDQKAEQLFTALLGQPQTRENGLRSLAFLDLYHGRYANAQGRLQQSLDLLRGQSSPLSEARVHLLLAIVAEGRGDAAEERRNLDEAMARLNEIQVKVVFGALLGDAYARAGFVNQAKKVAAVITPLADQSSAEQMGYLHLLEGEIASSAGQFDEGIELLKQSGKENSTALSTEALAHAYQRCGKIDEALASYEAMLRSDQRSLGWEPQQRWLEARVTLASDYAARGEKEKARKTLEGLLNRWKQADPNLPILKRAEAEYAKLQ